MLPPALHNLQAEPSGWPIIGHDRAIHMLRSSLRTGRLSHAFLFTGPEGIGKRTLAMAFAMTLNCQSEPPAGQTWPSAPCGLCSSCSRIAHGTHPDIVEVNLESQARAISESGKGKAVPAKELKIDIIREMQQNVGLSPHSGRWKVYIIGDADRMNEEASNALLKPLEEPPGHSILILLASDEGSVLPTISSRCMQVPLRGLSRSLLASRLVEDWGVDSEQAVTLAALSGGRLGYAVGLHSERDAFAKRRGHLEEMALLSGAPIVDRINAATRYAKLFTDARSDLYAMLDTWENWWRDVMVVKAAAPELATSIDQLTTLQSLAGKVTLKQASEAIALIQRARQQLLDNVNPRLALESLALNLP